MEAAPEDTGARLRWYGALLDAELAVALEGEARDGVFAPQLFTLENGRTVLAFEGEERLASVLGAADYAALPGRVLVAALAGQGVGLGVNLGSEAAYLMDAPAVDWLASVLAAAPVASVSGSDPFAPAEAPPALLAALEARLEMARGMAEAAFLAARGGRLVLVFTGAASQEPLARMAAEAAAFCGTPVDLDAGFLPAGVPAPAAARHVWDLSPRPDPAPGEAEPRSAGGPPRLR